MSYQVLARKWRPRSFREMVGQTHVLKALINALDNQRLHHAYLFTGTRGVGKTTIARILAKCLNCETGVSSTPCGECGLSGIDEGRFVDLIEVDAASRTKVEDTRELLDNVQYSPTRGRYKVYLIDEVHMLSSHSFNALLKTLEEPPPHVKFLLATTDPQKLPVTILSRCLQFSLKNMPPERVVEHLTTCSEPRTCPSRMTPCGCSGAPPTARCVTP
ncbi:DNA polymerase III subunits gamma and tau [Pseudomonas aeruginosa]|nr:DNA polymerase III subunits gamma and tau [Pseudomonas aeruginosa]